MTRFTRFPALALLVLSALPPLAIPANAAHATARRDAVSGSVPTDGKGFGGVSIDVTGEANQTVTVPGVGTLVINEQLRGAGGDLTVHALHLWLPGGDECIVAGARIGVLCVVPVKPSTWGGLKHRFR